VSKFVRPLQINGPLQGGGYRGRPLELLELIESSYASTKVTNSITWVKTAKGVIEQLDRNEEPLEAVGIYYEKYKDRTNKTFVKIGDLDFVNSENGKLPTYKEDFHPSSEF